MDKQAKIVEALRLRAEGLSYAKIGESLGVSGNTARIWCDPKAAECNRQRQSTPEYRERKRQRQSTPEYRERQQERQQGYKSTLKGRCKAALSASRSVGRKRNRAPCNASWEELAAAFTGYCDCCGRHESEFHKRLSMDHCHDTGNFRGWLCDKCNVSAGNLQDDAIPLLNYLRPDLSQRLIEALGQGAA